MGNKLRFKHILRAHSAYLLCIVKNLNAFGALKEALLSAYLEGCGVAPGLEAAGPFCPCLCKRPVMYISLVFSYFIPKAGTQQHNAGL